MSPPTSPSIDDRTVSVIIVNYGAAHLVVRNMPDILEGLEPFASARVIIVDNASPGDDAMELAALAEVHGDVTLVRADKNGGFAYGNNRGLEAAGESDLYFFLNPDARPRRGSIERLARTLLSREGAGVAGPLLVNEAGEVRASAFARFEPMQEYAASGGVAPRLLGIRGRVQELCTDEVIETSWIPGAAMLVRREVIERVGGMDEGYFLYFEETDWLEKIGKAGFKVLADGGAVVEHIEGVSTGVVSGKAERADLPAYWYDSWRRFWTRNRSRGEAALAALMFTAGLATGGLKRRLKGERGGQGPTLSRFVSLCLLPILRGEKS